MKLQETATATVGDLLAAARAADSSLEAQLLLAEILGRSRSWVLAHPEAELGPAGVRTFRGDYDRLLNGAALPHLLGWWEFYGRRFQVSPQVLIPRPETELMVEVALQGVRNGARILELGTGSGCVAVTLLLELSESAVIATDISREALQIAQSNARRHGVTRRAAYVVADLFSGIHGKFDLVCANLPYIEPSELSVLEVAKREPRVALDGGPGGLRLIRAALMGLARHLKSGGLALFEIDPRQRQSLAEKARSHMPSSVIQIYRDLSGRERLLAIRNA